MNIARPLVRSVAESKTEQITVGLMEDALEDIRPILPIYGDFYSYKTNNEGEIVLAEVNSSSVNQVLILVKNTLNKRVMSLENLELDVPVGAFSGLSVFAEEGSDIAIKVMPVGFVDGEITSEFSEKGINQTLHRVYVKASAEVKILIPVKSTTIKVTSSLLISEDIIIGRVPDSYITGATEDDTFDLLP